MALFIFVIDFYIESYITQKTDQAYSAKYGAIFVFSCSVGLSFIWNHPHIVKVTVMDKIKTVIEQEHALSWGVIIAYILFLLGKFSLLNKIESKIWDKKVFIFNFLHGINFRYDPCFIKLYKKVVII
jgi:hypothetical protein